MIRQQKKECIDCKQQQYIFSKKRCKFCVAKHVLKTTEKKVYSPTFKKKKPTGERAVHQSIWEKRPHICTGCNQRLNTPHAMFFSHIIPKKKRNDLRLVEENYLLECMQCHHIWDNGTIKQKMELNNFDEKLAYIKENDNTMYLKIQFLIKSMDNKIET